MGIRVYLVDGDGDRAVRTAWPRAGCARVVAKRCVPLGQTDGVSGLPECFCWSKIGAEAGETVDAIVARKEAARARDGGMFLWGIGQTITNSIRALLERTGDPDVIFTDMVGPAKVKDSAPASRVLWRMGRSALVRPSKIPHSRMTCGVRAVSPCCSSRLRPIQRRCSTSTVNFT